MDTSTPQPSASQVRRAIRREIAKNQGPGQVQAFDIHRVQEIRTLHRRLDRAGGLERAAEELRKALQAHEDRWSRTISPGAKAKVERSYARLQSQLQEIEAAIRAEASQAEEPEKP